MVCLGLLAFATVPSTLVHAQAINRAWIDAGAAIMRQSRSTARPALTLGVGGEHRATQWSWRADGALAMVSDSVAVTQTNTRVDVVPRRAAWSRTTLELGATTFGFTSPTSHGNTLIAIAQTLSTRGLSLTGGWSSGRTQRPALLRNGSALTAAAHATVGAMSVRVHTQRTTTNDWPLMEAAGYGLRVAAPRYVLMDVGIDVQWQWRDLAWRLAHTMRGGRDATTGQSRASIASMSWQPRPSWQLVLYGGQQLADPVRAVPQVYVGALQVRHALGQRGASASRWSTREVQLTRGARNTVLTIRVQAPADATVEIATSESGWAPQRMVHDGTHYVAALTLPSGAHRVAIRINGGAWRSPRGLVSVDDELGGTVGIVVVP